VPTGNVTTIVPVVFAQVGCVRVACGTDGAPATALTINEDNVELQLLSETLLTVKVYVVFGASPENVVADWKIPPILYS
jgi:hypothetical protein